MSSLQPLFDKLLIKPKNYSLYIQALTHPSYSHIMNLDYSYQRLEFLGDAIIDKNVREFLFKKYPDKDEGEMTKIKIMIVQSHTEVLAAKYIELNKYVLLEKSLIDQHGNISDKILEDSFEAIIAAIYFDLGEKEVFKVLKRTIIHLYEIHYLDKTSLDYKSLFQEAVQKYGKKRIRYISSNFTDSNGDQKFRVELWTNNICYGIGFGTKKKRSWKISSYECL